MKFGIRLAFVSLLGLSLLLLPTLATAQHYHQVNLVGNPNPSKAPPGPAPNLLDSHLVNPWGLTRSATSPWWVANNGTGTSTLYNGNGNGSIVQRMVNGQLVQFVVNIPPTGSSTPTGTVFNGTSDFSVGIAVSGPNAGKPAPGVFFFATEDGTISGWNPTVDPLNSIQVVAKKNAVYKGLTLAEANGQHYLYAANFHSGRVEVYDTNFKPVKFLGDAFEDERLPGGYAPFNVQAIGKNIIVSFAKQQLPDKHDEVDGAGLGFVDVFSTTGRLLLRLQHGLWMNAPWGIALAPGEFGEFSHSLLIGQFGGGNIAAFSPFTGHFRGNILNEDGSTFSIPGLWAIGFGNNNGTLVGNPPAPPAAGPYNTLFFTAGINGETDGLFGTLTAVGPELTEADEP